MELNWLESILYSLVSGVAQFLPVSARVHEALLLRLFGSDRSPWLDILIHGAVLAALLMNIQPLTGRLRVTRRLMAIPKRRRKRQPERQSMCDLRLLKTAGWPLLLSFIAFVFTRSWEANMLVLAGMLLLNGLILYIPMHLPTGNKDSRSMSGFDSLLFGIGSGLGSLPGISRVGAGASVAVARGAEPQQALNWSLLLSVPALVCCIGFDVYSIFVQGFAGMSFWLFVQFLLSSAASFAGAYVAIILVRFMAVKLGFTGFAYYSWGMALLVFVLYLLI